MDVGRGLIHTTMNSMVVKIIVAISIFYLSYKDTPLAILLAITFILSIRNVPGHKTLNKVRNIVKEIPSDVVRQLKPGSEDYQNMNPGPFHQNTHPKDSQHPASKVQHPVQLSDCEKSKKDCDSCSIGNQVQQHASELSGFNGHWNAPGKV